MVWESDEIISWMTEMLGPSCLACLHNRTSMDSLSSATLQGSKVAPNSRDSSLSARISWSFLYMTLRKGQTQALVSTTATTRLSSSSTACGFSYSSLPCWGHTIRIARLKIIFPGAFCNSSSLALSLSSTSCFVMTSGAVQL